jgi:hypothetical protein
MMVPMMTIMMMMTAGGVNGTQETHKDYPEDADPW